MRRHAMGRTRSGRAWYGFIRFGLVLSALSALPAPVCADISGTLTTQGGKPVAGAYLRFTDAFDPTRQAQTVTDAQGAYSLKLPPAGTAIRPAHESGIPLREPVPGAQPGAFDPRGRWFRMGSALPEGGRPVAAGIYFPVSGAQGGTAARKRAPPAGGYTASVTAAERLFHVTIHGKGIYPYQARGLALADGETRDFGLAASDLWDSTRAILRDNLADCGSRFKDRKQGRIAFLGGSITFNPGWRDSVQDYLKSRFPGTAFDFINAGIPSVGSDMHGFRLRRDVLEKGKVDLLFFESAVNDTTNGVSSITRTRAYEGILRQAWRDNPDMDVIYLYFADPSFYPNYQAGKPNSLISDYERIAVPYGVSAIHLSQYVAEHYTWAQFGGDVHPGPLGQGIYFRGIRRLLEAAWAGPAVSQPVLPVPLPHAPPAAMLDSLCFHQGHTDTIAKAVLANGWRRIASWVPAQGGTRDGFFKVPVLESTTPGDTLRFAFTGSAVGAVIPAGPDAGMIEYAIDGKVLGTKDQFTPWSSGLNIPWTLLFSTDLAMKAHELRLVVAPGKNAASTGRACRIIRFVVNGPG
jgi:sialidase-1